MENRFLCRGKRIDNGEWVEGCYVLIDNHCYIYTGSLCNGGLYVVAERFEIQIDTLCQCTGLKDKNGKLIWKNDIVNGSIKRGAAFYRCLVLWNECKARFDVRAMDCNFPMTLDECTDDISMSGFDYEVVGNIFDNPELLEV